jgi:hypothetical protein
MSAPTYGQRQRLATFRAQRCCAILQQRLMQYVVGVHAPDACMFDEYVDRLMNACKLSARAFSSAALPSDGFHSAAHVSHDEHVVRVRCNHEIHICTVDSYLSRKVCASTNDCLITWIWNTCMFAVGVTSGWFGSWHG